jgi:hypothetical protein
MGYDSRHDHYIVVGVDEASGGADSSFRVVASGGIFTTQQMVAPSGTRQLMTCDHKLLLFVLECLVPAVQLSICTRIGHLGVVKSVFSARPLVAVMTLAQRPSIV